MLWATRTWAELPEDLAAAGQAAILPVGATEQHGPHMCCGMDTVLADKLCTQVAERTGVPMLPVISYGCSLGHSRRWPGTIPLQPATLMTLVKEVGDGAYRSGVRRLFIINTHVTNSAPLRCALEMLRAEHDDLMVALINSPHVSERVRDVHFADADDWHANEAETALMLALAPEMVRPGLMATADDPDRTRDLVFAHPVNRTSLNGVTGNPSAATGANGERWFAWMVEDLSALIARGLFETPPLDRSYVETVHLQERP